MGVREWAARSGYPIGSVALHLHPQGLLTPVVRERRLLVDGGSWETRAGFAVARALIIIIIDDLIIAVDFGSDLVGHRFKSNEAEPTSRDGASSSTVQHRRTGLGPSRSRLKTISHRFSP